MRLSRLVGNDLNHVFKFRSQDQAADSLSAIFECEQGLLQNLMVLQPPFFHIYKTLSAFHFAPLIASS